MGVVKIVFYFWYGVLMCVAFPIRLALNLVESIFGIHDQPKSKFDVEEEDETPKRKGCLVRCKCRAPSPTN